MSRRLILCCAVAGFVLGSRVGGQRPTPSQAPVFKSGVDLVLVDVVVRDKGGAVIRGLKPDDFELLENGVKQDIVSFAFEDINPSAAPVERGAALAAAAPPKAEADTPTHPLTSDEAAGHRLLTIVFDTSSMQPDDVQRAIDGAAKWVNEQMTSADLVAVASINSSLQVLTDFTSDKEHVRQVLSAFATTDGTAFSTVDASTAATDEANQVATADATTVDQSAQELDTFNNDVRLRALKTLAEALQPIQQKKAILYFSSGLQRSGTDNQVELRAAVNAALRANAAIYPVDTRGLQAVVPGGSARQGSRGGLGAFSGSAVATQFSQLAAQQETLVSLASDTGGTAFTDSNDFGEAFSKVERDISSYYILGFSSTNTAPDGRFRRLTVRLKNRALNAKVEAKDGYYANRDFAHTSKADREEALQEQLSAPIAATDVPLFVTGGWFRLAADKYYVPVSVAIPGSAVPVSKDKTTMDIAGIIRDERGFPVGRVRDTLTVPAASTETLASKQVLYQTGMTLPPGRFTLKIVVRENAGGLMGAFETALVVPELKQALVKVSSLVLGTQLQSATDRRSSNPLVHDGAALVPNLTHIVRRDQPLYFYYEVYDPSQTNGTTRVQTSLAFYRGKVKVFETPIVERTMLDDPNRRAAVFQFQVSADRFKPGLYTCQVNIIDENATQFAFRRLELYIR